MIRRGIAIAALFGASWAPPAGVLAAPPAAEKPAAAPQPQTEESRITRAIKAAEQEGFEHHELERQLAVFAPDARIVLGRRSEPDAHDIVWDLKTLRGVLARRYRLSPSKQQQIFFRDVVVHIEGDSATMTAVMTREHHTGRDEIKARYRLTRREGAWRVVERRSWPLMRSYGGLPTIYSDETWLTAEEQAKATMADPGSNRQARLSALTQAGLLEQAYAEGKAWTVEAPKDVEAWRVRRKFALEVGKLADVEQCDKALAALGDPDEKR